MTDRPAAQNREWLLFVLVCVYIVLQFLWRAFTRAGEWPLPPYHYLSMALDLALIVVAVMLFSALGKRQPEGGGQRAARVILFVPALLAGIGMFVIRFSSDVGWWTGHIRNWMD
jgi:hypothetical protein